MGFRRRSWEILALRLLAMWTVSVVMFIESFVAEGLRLGAHGVVATSMGLHGVPSGFATWHIRSSFVEQEDLKA